MGACRFLRKDAAMRRWLGLGLIVLAANLSAQEPAKFLTRYNIEFNPINFPQKTPPEAMKSIAKAMENGRFDYMLAHLTDPKYVDPRVADYQAIIVPKDEIQREEDEIAREPDAKKRKAKMIEKERKDKARVVVAFNRLVVETRKNFEEDPILLKEIRLLAKSGEWEVDNEKAVGTLKNVTPRRIVLRKREDRWFVEEKSQ
jgi:hypothetical protein